MLKFMFKHILSSLLLICLVTAQAIGQSGIPSKPSPPRLVNNLSKEMPYFLSQPEIEALEAKLTAFERETSNQITVVIVDDLAGFEPWEYATEIGDQWQVGQAKEDNGIVILIKPTGGKGERKYFIAIGRGLEGKIPDVTARRIEEKELVPNFKNGNYYLGIDKTVDALMGLAKGEFNSSEYSKNKKSPFEVVKVILVIALIVIFIIVSIRSNKRNGGRGGRGGGMSILGDAILFGMMSGGGRSSGGGFGSGSSGGGFGGFGGGSFGGGGSGGSW